MKAVEELDLQWWFDPEDAPTWPEWYRSTPMGLARVPPLDLAFGAGDLCYAVEHSTVEATARQGHQGAIARQVFSQFEAELSGKLPTPGHYALSVEFMAIHSTKQARDATPALRTWVERIAPTLAQEKKWQQWRAADRAPDDRIPFRVSLSREFGWEGYDWDGRLHVFNLVHGSRGATRYRRERWDRMKANIRSNLPKLQAWQKAGFTTALVLDYSGMGMDAFEDSVDELLAELKRRKRLPDYVFFALASMYGNYAPRRVGWLYELRRQGETISKFDPRFKVDFDY